MLERYQVPSLPTSASWCLKANATCFPESGRVAAPEDVHLPAILPCCEGDCFVPRGQQVGFCPWKICIDDNHACFANASSGICCSGFCGQVQGEPNGTCADPNNRRMPPVFIPLPQDGPQPQPTSVENTTGPYIYGLIGTSAALLLLLVLGAAVWCRMRGWTFGRGKERPPPLPLATYAHLKPLLTDACRKFEVDKQDFCVDSSLSGLLGKGEFGVVLKARLRGVTVAAKTASLSVEGPSAEVAGAAQWMALLQELKVRVHVGLHENLVALVGAHTQRLRQGVCYVFVELCANGNLEEYLDAHRDTFPGLPQPKPGEYVALPPTGREPGFLSPKHLRLWSRDICAGMEHLASLPIVHSDLATRNVLLSERLVAKIGDFGLSQRVYDTCRGYVTRNANTGAGSRGRIPWQHMAPEALTHLKFSEQSDVWAFGVTLWQLYTLGGQLPYAPLEWKQDFAQMLVNGTRLSQPEHAPNGVYELMRVCWALEPRERPSFEELHGALQEI